MRASHAVIGWTAAALVAAAPAARGQGPGKYSFGADDLAIYDLVGTLRAEAGTGSSVVVEVTFAGRDAAQLKVAAGPRAGHDGLRVIFPGSDLVYPALGPSSETNIDVADDGSFGDDDGGRRVRVGGSGEGLEAWADLTVSIPAGKTVALHVGVGKAILTNVDGRLRVDLASADLLGSGTRGALDAETGSGDIELTNTAGDLRLETGSGDVTVRGLAGGIFAAETGSGDIRAGAITADRVSLETGSGDISLAGVKSPEVKLDAGSGGVTVSHPEGIRSLSVETGSGDVALGLPAGVGADLDIETSSGDIDLGGFSVLVRHMARDHIAGRLGAGGAEIRIEAGSGDVTLRRE